MRNYFVIGGYSQFNQTNSALLGGPIPRQDVPVRKLKISAKSGPQRCDLCAHANARKGLLPCSGLTTVPVNCTATTPLTNVGVASVVAPLFALWPAPQQELLTSGGLPTGIAESFSNPVQRIREDFGTARLDHNFSDTDSLAGVYTIDDSYATSPTPDPSSLVYRHLARAGGQFERNAHLFAVARQQSHFRFSRGGFLFHTVTFHRHSPVCLHLFRANPREQWLWEAALPSMAPRKSLPRAPMRGAISRLHAICSPPRIR